VSTVAYGKNVPVFRFSADTTQAMKDPKIDVDLTYAKENPLSSSDMLSIVSAEQTLVEKSLLSSDSLVIKASDHENGRLNSQVSTSRN